MKFQYILKFFKNKKSNDFVCLLFRLDADAVMEAENTFLPVVAGSPSPVAPVSPAIEKFLPSESPIAPGRGHSQARGKRPKVYKFFTQGFYEVDADII